LPIIVGASGSSRGIATVACARERDRDDEGAVALARGPDDREGRDEDEEGTFRSERRRRQARLHCE
jgi:hypothetical protein